MDYLPRKADNDCLIELRWIYDRRSIEEAHEDLVAWLKKWAGRYPKLCDWVEANIGETLAFYRLTRKHHKNLKSTNLLERLNEELKRRTLVVRIFPNAAACLRLIRAQAVEIPTDPLRTLFKRGPAAPWLVRLSHMPNRVFIGNFACADKPRNRTASHSFRKQSPSWLFREAHFT